MMDTDRKGMGYLFPSSRAAVEYGNAKGVKAPPKRHRLQLTDCAIHAQGRGGRARERRTCDQGRFWRVPHGYGQSRGRDGRQHNLGRRRIHGRLRAVPHRLDRSGEVELRQRIRGASCHGAQRRAAGHGRFGGARRQDHRLHLRQIRLDGDLFRGFVQPVPDLGRGLQADDGGLRIAAA